MQIPSFFLYGEPPQGVGERFLHLEALDDRARPANWNIRPHTHMNLSHIFYISEGRGQMHADGSVATFHAPCLLLVPSLVVHAFAFDGDARGSVLTLSDEYLQELVRREYDLRRVFIAPVTLVAPDALFFRVVLERLTRELVWTAPGHGAAVEALLVTILVEILRLMHHAQVSAPRRNGAHAALVARFRECLEANYRQLTGVEAYAKALNVNSKRLRAACLRIARATPGRIIQDRLLLEAKRLMLYSNMTVAEAAYYLGFDDPAYFTRFFTKGCGSSPRAFRKDPDTLDVVTPANLTTPSPT